jgi:hypothetical protein
MTTSSLAGAVAALLLLPTTSAAPPPGNPAPHHPCTTIAVLGLESNRHELREELLIRLATCVNLTAGDELTDCFQDALDDYNDGLDEAQEVYDARLELCDLIGEVKHDPDIDPADFVQGIHNPLLPFERGRTWTYEADTGGELEVVEIAVLADTIEIEGVECTIVRDTVTVDGVLLEDTFDWYAEDTDGNVWYFGELAMNYEDGLLVDLDGSWRAGVDGARPGIVMFADPVVGTTYRQELLLGEAEDAATILADSVDVTVPAGTFCDCLQTEDFTPLEPGVTEYKVYAPGVGLVLEVDPMTGEMLELVQMTP